MDIIRQPYGIGSMIHEVNSTEAELEALVDSDSDSYHSNSDSGSYSHSDSDSDIESMTESDTDYKYAFVQDCKSSDDLDLTACVLLHSESTTHAFYNRAMVNNIFHVDKPMNLLSIGGQISINIRCHDNNLSLDQPVWFHPK